MIGRPARLAACTLASLLLAAPALAQSGPGDDRRTLGPSYAEAQGRNNDFVGDDGALFASRTGTGIGVSSQPYVEDDGTRGTRKGVVGSMGVAPGASLDLGLFSVNRISARERSLSRANPMRDVGERSSTMAAVGLRVRFR